jgi:hypothetical protein
MTRSRQSLGAIAMGVALAVVFAAVAIASSATTEPYPNHTPLRGSYPGSYAPADASISAAVQRHPNHKPLRAAGYRAEPVSAAAAASYANHKPVRGDYPGSYPGTETAPTAGSSDSFDWGDAGIGAAIMFGLLLLLTAAKAGGARARQRYAA